MEKEKIMISFAANPDYKIEVEKGLTILEIVAQKAPKLYKLILAAKVNGRMIDLGERINEDSVVQILTGSDDEGLNALRHTAAHVLAQAVKRLIPDAKLAIGPAIS